MTERRSGGFFFRIPPNFDELPEDEQRAIAAEIHRQMCEAWDVPEEAD